MLQRKLQWNKSFKQRAVFNGYLHDFTNRSVYFSKELVNPFAIKNYLEANGFLNAKIHDANAKQPNTNP